MILQPGQQAFIWTRRHGYWLFGRGIGNSTCLEKRVIGVQTQQGIATVRQFSELDQADEAWRDVLAGNATPPQLQAKEYGPRHAPQPPDDPAPPARHRRQHHPRRPRPCVG